MTGSRPAVAALNEQDPATVCPARLRSGRAADRRVLFLAADDRLNYEGVLRVVDLAKSRVDDLQIEFLSTD